MKVICLIFLTALAPWALAGTSTFGSGNSYMWGSNSGWIELIPSQPNAGDGVAVGDSFLSGYAWSANTGWINFGDGTPSNGIHYSNTDGSDSGVNHDGAGNLSGLAWSANLGWINFGWWSDPQDANRPHFDLITGVFSGYVWSASSGWITLGTGLLTTDSMLVVDSDGDGISDAWELAHAADLTTLSASGDADGDGVGDVDEYQADTDPMDPAEYLRITALDAGDTTTDLTWTSQPTRLYRINQSTTLNSWTLGSETAPDAGPLTSRTAAHPSGPRRFFRVESIVPLQP